MEYAGSYALYNYRLEDPSLGMQYTNLRLIRAFEHGLDPSSSEAGFVLVHVDMVKHSGELVEGAVTVLEGCATADRDRFDQGMEGVLNAMSKVNTVMDGKLPRPQQRSK
jgi:indoleamine 2,3-dioxygenase